MLMINDCKPVKVDYEDRLAHGRPASASSWSNMVLAFVCSRVCKTSAKNAETRWLRSPSVKRNPVYELMGWSAHVDGHAYGVHYKLAAL